jgi:asparagine synthase (glutamine-hydrolysing)
VCGICGKYYFVPVVDKNLAPLIKGMCDSMYHRGPDDEGFYIQEGIGLGHRRLSIIDLGTGKQPIYNEDGSVVVIFNGEIYNYKDLREILQAKGHVFKTGSDTEVIVHAYEEYGDEFLAHLRGMFAIALWDKKTRTLIIARDRLGIKPLYFSVFEKMILFASEIKAILKNPEFKDIEVNKEAIDSFLRFDFIPGQETIFKKIRRLLPGWYLKVRNGYVQEIQYWDLKYGSRYHDYSFQDLTHSLDSLLRETIREHMLSDVPIGFLLSGGIDSTALLSYAINETNKDISSFTIGFDGQDFVDERKTARIAARKFGTRHHEMTFGFSEFKEFLPEYIYHMEEPVCEPPAIALYYISKYASEHVKVLISGEGGDEAFAGYPNYRNYNIVNRINKALGPLRNPLAKIIRNILEKYPNNRYRKYGSIFGKDLNDYYYSRTSGPLSYFNENYASIYSQNMSEVHRDNFIFKGFMDKYNKNNNHMTFIDKMLYIDSKTWLPDDLLIKADKITMANSVELRVPFLDHKVMEFAANIPSKYKVHGKTTKYILKKTLSGIIPKELIHRKKAGFPVPYGKWLRNEMYDFSREILLDDQATRRGYFDKKELENMVKENKSSGVYSKEIFSLLVLELWHRRFLDSPVTEGTMR